MNALPVGNEGSAVSNRKALRQKRTVLYLVTVMVLLVIADGLISQHIAANGLGTEGNPLLRTIIGGPSFLSIKAGGSALAALLLWDLYRRLPKAALIASTVAVLFYTTVVYWNLGVFVVGSP